MQSLFYFPRPSRVVQTIQARTRSLDIEPDLIGEIINMYGLELIRAQNLPLGRRSHNVIVDTPAGRKVLKRYRSKWQMPTIRYGHSILTRLAERSFPAPRVVHTPENGTFVQHNGRYYALFHFVAGRNYAATYLRRAHWLKLAALSGQCLARFHQQLEGFLPDGQHHLGFISYTQDRWRDGQWYVEQLGHLKAESRYLNQPEAKSQAAWLGQQAGRMSEDLQRVSEILQAAALPRLIIHGDFAIQNLLFEGNGRVTPMDFELARLEWRLSDLVTSLIRFGLIKEDNFDYETMRTFVVAYQNENPITAEEWQCLPHVWQFRRLKRAILAWQAGFHVADSAAKLISARQALRQADTAVSHRKELLSLAHG